MEHHSIVILPNKILAASNIVGISVENLACGKASVVISLKRPVCIDESDYSSVYMTTKNERIARDCMMMCRGALTGKVSEVNLSDMAS